MIEFLNSLEWPAVFAIVGSLVTIVTGLFGYLLAARRQETAKATTHTLTTEEYEKIHSRINDLVDRVASNEGDLKEMRVSIRSLQCQISNHEQRDIDDFKLLEAKLDRLMDIIVRILQED
jgi:CRISPR/Cas system CSM-associated protein Csm2 small subunit